MLLRVTLTSVLSRPFRVQDDLALMVEGDDGRYYFQAGAICVAGFWRMQDKIGLPLDAIHTEGNVPQCEILLSIPSMLDDSISIIA